LDDGVTVPHPGLEEQTAGENWEEAHGRPPRPPLTWIDMSSWDSEPVPKRGWLVRDRIPLRQPTLLSGEGAVGKSLLILHLLASTALGRDWLGFLPEPGGAWYFGAEDDADELHIRLSAIQSHFGVSFAELVRSGFRMKSLFSEDAVLGAPNRNGIVEPTELYNQLYEQVGDLKPKCIGLDASADLFAGDEINRVQTRQFVGLLRRLAAACERCRDPAGSPELDGYQHRHRIKRLDRLAQQRARTHVPN
jgi:RecA-family ATPase